MYLAVADGWLPLESDTETSMTKLGGTATFMQPLKKEVAKKVEDLRWCRQCGDAMFLVSQCFCPIDDEDGIPENRMMYVYACNSSSCNNGVKERSWTCFTVQHDADDEAALDAEDDFPENVPMATREQLPPSTFPPMALYIDEEPEGDAKVEPTDMERELITMAEKNAEAGDIPDSDIKELEEAIDMKDKTVDEEYEDFRATIAKSMKQALRYQRGGEPLFMHPSAVKDKLRVPACSLCGAPRMLEMQVMPATLYFLRSSSFVGTNKRKEDDGMDFGTVSVYTCSAGCTHGKKGVTVNEEFVFVEPPPTLKDDQQEATKPSLRDVMHAADTSGRLSGSDADEEEAGKKKISNPTRFSESSGDEKP